MSNVRMSTEHRAKNQNAITLISLTISIIILLILAGVALSLVVGENGITERAVKAGKTYDITGAKEQVDALVASYASEYYEKKYTSGNLENDNGVDGYIASQLNGSLGEYDFYSRICLK